jgi:hypothetical protein
MFEGRVALRCGSPRFPWVDGTVGSAAQVGAGMIMIRRKASTMSAAHGQPAGMRRWRRRLLRARRAGTCSIRKRRSFGSALADGYRYQAFATNTRIGQLAFLEARHRAHARVEDRIKAAKDIGLGRLPSREYAINQDQG